MNSVGIVGDHPRELTRPSRGAVPAIAARAGAIAVMRARAAPAGGRATISRCTAARTGKRAAVTAGTAGARTATLRRPRTATRASAAAGARPGVGIGGKNCHSESSGSKRDSFLHRKLSFVDCSFPGGTQSGSRGLHGFICRTTIFRDYLR